MSAILNDDASPGVRTAELYEPFDFLVVRAPLLPIETYHALGATVASLSSASATDPPAGSDDIRRALAIGSVTFLDALRPDRNQDGRRRKIDGTLRRYLIRMSTRPTPFGLFAGVGLGRWGDRTDLQLSSGRRRQRTRPDMGWLMSLVDEMESDPEVRRHLQLVTNPTASYAPGECSSPNGCREVRQRCRLRCRSGLPVWFGRRSPPHGRRFRTGRLSRCCSSAGQARRPKRSNGCSPSCGNRRCC